MVYISAMQTKESKNINCMQKDYHTLFYQASTYSNTEQICYVNIRALLSYENPHM